RGARPQVSHLCRSHRSRATAEAVRLNKARVGARWRAISTSKWSARPPATRHHHGFTHSSLACWEVEVRSIRELIKELRNALPTDSRRDLRPGWSTVLSDLEREVLVSLA